MKKLSCILVLIFLLCNCCFAYSLKEIQRLKESDFKNILPGKMFTMDRFLLLNSTGDVFILARDEKTRGLEWYLVNPFSRKIVKKGDCSFKVFSQAAISPDGSSALVTSQFPQALWFLDLEKGKWKKVYENPQKEGLAFLSISPITFVENPYAFSILDLWDDEHFVIDTYITSINLEPFLLEKLVSLRTLKDLAMKEIIKTPSPDRIYSVDFMRFGKEKSLTYVVKSRLKREKGSPKDYLVRFSSPQKVILLDEVDGRILPLDYHTNPVKVLYSTTSKDKVEVIYQENGKKQVLMEGKAVAGRIMKNNLIGVTTVEGGKFAIYLGTPSKKLTRVEKLGDAYSVGFVEEGTKLVLTNRKEVLCFKIMP